ncbi:MAG: ATP-binding protein, partial [Thermomicrobiales bacterium]
MADSAETTAHTTPPTPRTRLIGREQERATARGLLIDESVPLLMLTGPGGVGKTRVALAVASDVESQFADGVVWVDLAALNDPGLVPLTVARALGIVPGPDVTFEEAIARHLHPQQTLLLIDNCEHLLTAIAALASSLLATCPALQLLTTSRAPLRVRGEQEFPVEPFPLPSAAEAAGPGLVDNPAVRLFLERARAVNPNFASEDSTLADVAEICRRLDGLPLAIELAAAHARVLSAAALRDRLERRLSLLE